MTESRRLYLRAAGLGALDYAIGGLVGLLVTSLLLASGISEAILGLTEPFQLLIKLIVGILLVFLLVGIGGAVIGFISGFALYEIDKTTKRDRYVRRSALAFGLANGILFPIFVLSAVVISFYNNADSSNPLSVAGYTAGLGLVYGALLGILLGLLTVKFRDSWRITVASLIGFTLGGYLAGLVLFRIYEPTTRGLPAEDGLLWIALFAIALYGVAGLFLGPAFRWSAVKQAERGNQPTEMSQRARRIRAVALGLLIVYIVVFIVQILNFVRINPASYASMLPSDTVGVHWSAPETQPVGAVTGLTETGVSSRPDGVQGLVWNSPTVDGSDVFYTVRSQNEDRTGEFLLEPVDLSRSPDAISTQPQIVSDAEGVDHVLWNEDGVILYSACSVLACSTPVDLSAVGSDACAAPGVFNDSPALAVNEDGELAAAWSAGEGQLAYAIWDAAGEPGGAVGCIETPGGAGAGGNAPRLAANRQGGFYIVSGPSLARAPGPLNLYTVDGSDWESLGPLPGTGRAPAIFTNRLGGTQLAWCDDQGQVQTQPLAGSSAPIEFPTCGSRPAFSDDVDGQPHLLWYADAVIDTNGAVSPANLIYESILTANGWSEPAIAAQVGGAVQPEASSDSDGWLHLVWGADNFNLSAQAPFVCTDENLSPYGKAILDVATSGRYRPTTDVVPHCGNQYDTLVHLPNPQFGFSSETPSANGGFDKIADLVKTANYEVLFMTMQWDENTNGRSPGSIVIEAVGELYQQIQEDPSRYPKGLTVRILLGNYPVMANFEWGTQIWSVLSDLRDAGVDTLVDEEIGWRVEVANFEGVLPHGHTKFVIVDGATLMGNGFNMAYYHYPRGHISGRGDELTDLGIQVTGPVAQQAMLAYDDLWSGSDQIVCSTLRPTIDAFWQLMCEETKAVVDHVPEVKKYFVTQSDAQAFSLHHTMEYLEADEAIAGALALAEDTVDVMEVNFAMDLSCVLGSVLDGYCFFGLSSTPYMEALLSAAENGAQVRVITEQSGGNGVENTPAIQALQSAFALRDLEDQLEVRFFNGRVHTKAVLIDDTTLVVGSQNFHWSAWGDLSLTEYNVAVEDPQAVEDFKAMFDFYWESAIPSDIVIAEAEGSGQQ